MNSYTKGYVRQSKISLSTQRTDYSLRAMKIDSNTESHAGCKEDSWYAMDNDVKGCNQEGTSARSGQTSF